MPVARTVGGSRTVNCLNPGPVDTGCADPDRHEQVARHFPAVRWTTPAETAGVVGLLVSPDSAPITGQVTNAEAGFRGR